MKSTKAKGHAEETRDIEVMIHKTQSPTLWLRCRTISKHLLPAVLHVEKELSGVYGLSVTQRGHGDNRKTLQSGR